jgi:hypothetical protein
MRLRRSRLRRRSKACSPSRSFCGARHRLRVASAEQCIAFASYGEQGIAFASFGEQGIAFASFGEQGRRRSAPTLVNLSVCFIICFLSFIIWIFFQKKFKVDPY